MAGLAADGGLYVPVEVPPLALADLDRLRSMSYAELATEVICAFADDIPRDVIARVCSAAYSMEVFGSSEVAPLTELDKNLYLLHLSNGPTIAFKDMAMQFLARLFDEILAEDESRLTVLGATSGDTGSSAEHAMKGRDRVGIVMLSPWQRMSPFQAAQMYTLDEPNIVNLAIDGVFDQAQDLVKDINGDARFKKHHNLGAVNSINWARIATQIVYYVWAFLEVSPAGHPVTFSVPTGNFGNIYAGLVAQRMGLPLRFVLATNENDVLAEFFETGRYRVRGKDEVAATSSPSMDIAKASNFERFVHDVTGDSDELLRLWKELATTGGFELSGSPVWEAVRRRDVTAGSSSHADRLATIAEVSARYGRIIDPHTADGLFVGRGLATPGIPLVCLETALATKFETTIREALGRVPARSEQFVGLEAAQHHVTVIPADAVAVRDHIERFTDTWRSPSPATDH